MNIIFVDVDTQRDFLEAGGALHVAGSSEIEANLARLSAFAREHGVPVIATACDHDPHDDEFEVFPPHCVRGTRGRERIDATAHPDTVELPLGRAHDGATPAHLTIHKNRYDVFHRPEAEAVFARYADARPDATFVVYGVATDYCVKCVVEGLLERGHRVAVVVDAVRAVDPANEAETLTRFVERGALLTLTESVARI